MKVASAILSATARIMTVLALLLAIDLLLMRFRGTEYGQVPALDGFLPIWLGNVAIALVLGLVAWAGAAALHGLFPALRRAEPARLLGFELTPRRKAAFFAALVIGLAAYAKTGHVDQGWRTCLFVTGLVALATFAIVSLWKGRFRLSYLVAAHLVLAGAFFAAGWGALGGAEGASGPGRGTWGAPIGESAAGGNADAAETDPAPPASSPNVFFLVVDTVRADHVSSYGSARQTTPHLDRFAERALFFENAFSGSAATSPSTAALLGSPFPYTNDFVENGRKAQFTTLPGLLQGAGYATAAFSANPWISRAMGFDRGFEHFRNLYWLENEFAMNHMARGFVARLGHPSPDFLTGSALNAEAVRWLRRQPRDRPLFCYMHYMDPHYPYTPTKEFRTRVSDRALTRGERYPANLVRGRSHFVDGGIVAADVASDMMSLYDAEIMQWDQAFEDFRAFLESEGWLENAIVIVTADHGEAFFEHRTWGHGNSLFNEVIHVPLVIYRSWDTTREVVAQPVSNARITQLLKAIVETPAAERGALDWGALLTQEGGRVVSQVSSDEATYRGGAVVEGGRKSIVIRKGEEERRSVFEIDRDPKETDDRAVAASAVDSLVIAAGAHLPMALDQSPRGEIDESRRELLKSLGYVE